MASDSVHPYSLGPGTILDGKYEILTCLGVGGMGEVFKARHLHLNTFRCIKVMKQSLLDDESIRMRFLREARLATQIHHPNIAAVHDFFLGQGGSYMVSEFIDGTTLRQWSARHGPFPLPLAADVASQVLAGLDHIHRRGLLHRDISADNVMLSFDADERLTAKIIDLGIAKDTNTSSDATMAGIIIGNPKYMSPEQFGSIPDGEQLDGRADLYSLGVVLYEMLLGVPPFASETPQGYIMKHLTEKPRPFAEARPGIEAPVGIEAIILRALEKDRQKRFDDARAFAAELERFLIAAPGSLTTNDVMRLRRGPEKTVETRLPPQAVAERTDSTDAKARLFEISLLEEIATHEKEGDREALQRFAEAHPKGSSVGDAAREALVRLAEERRRLEDAAFEAARSGGRKEIQTFIREWPESPRIKEAKKLLRRAQDAADLEQAEETDSPAAWQLYLTAHPRGRGVERARERLATLENDAFEATAASSNPDEAESFLAAFPNSPHRQEMSSLISAWREAAAQAKKAAEPAEWNKAWECGTAAAWDRYLAENPDSHRIDDARNCRHEAADFELAVATNTSAMWRAFLKSWPDGRHHIEAAIRMRGK